MHKRPELFAGKRPVVVLELKNSRLLALFPALCSIWLLLRRIAARFGPVDGVLHRLGSHAHRSPFRETRVRSVGTYLLLPEPEGRAHDIDHPRRPNENFLDLQRVIRLFVVADYNRSVEDNFRFLGDVGSLVGTAQNSDLVHVETSDYNFAVHDQLAHTSNK